MFVLARRIDDLHHLAAFVIAVAGGVAQRIGFAAAVAALIVTVAPAIAGLVGLYPGQRPVFQPQGRLAAAQRVDAFAEVAGLIVQILPLSALRIGGAQQLALVVPLKAPGQAHGVGVFGDLVLRVPVATADPLQAVGDPGDTGVDVVVETVLVAVVGPVPGDAPVVGRMNPFVEAAQAAGQLVLDHAPTVVVGKASLQLAARVADFGKIAVAVVGIADQQLARGVAVQALDMADPRRPLAAVNQLDLNLIEGVAQPEQAATGVVVEVDAVVVTITQLRQAQALRVARGWLEQAIEAGAAFDQQLVVEGTAHAQALAGAEHRIAAGNVAHVDDPRLFVGE